MAYGIGPTASGLLDRDYQESQPFGPAGLTDPQRQGYGTMLEGLAGQYGVAQDYAAGYDAFGDVVGGYLGSAFNQARPEFNSAYGAGGSQGGSVAGYGGGGYGGGGGGSGSDFYNQMGQYYQGATDPTRFNQAMGMTEGALGGIAPGMYGAARMNEGVYGSVLPGLQNAAGLTGAAASQYGGGFDPSIAQAMNQVGASFDPYNNPALLESVQAANQRLAQDFNEGTMQQLDQQLSAAGPGAFGGSRAGVAQGIRETALADAMADQTAQMMSAGYETGLNRYVQDRGTTLEQAMAGNRLGAEVGLTGAGQLADIAGTQGQLGLTAANQMGNVYNQLGGLNLSQAGQLGSLANALGQLGISAGQGYLSAGNTAVDAAARRYAAQQQAAASRASAAASASASKYGADVSRYLGELNAYNEQQANALNAYGNYLTGNYEAGSTPYDIMGQYGATLGEFGGLQQGANQNLIDYYNAQASEMANYGTNAFNNYVNQVNAITNPGTQTTTSETPNYFNQGVGGASLGYSIGNTFFGNSGNSNTGNVAGDANYPAQQYYGY